MKRKRIYVAGLYSRTANGDKAGVLEVLANMKKGISVCNKLIRNGYAPFCPWLDYLFSLVGDYVPRAQDYYDYSLAWLEGSHAVFVISEHWTAESGVSKEILRAQELNIPIFYDVWELTKWNASQQT